MEFMILVYPDGQPVALDESSGGYPIRAGRPSAAHIWTSDEERDRYQEMFKDEGFKKAVLCIKIVMEE